MATTDARHGPATHRREQVGKQPVREQRLTMLMQKREDRVRRQRLTAEPAHRIQEVQLLRSHTQRHTNKLPKIDRKRWPPRQWQPSFNTSHL
ncbi:hypothetical protein ACLQ25_32580, partial [Micromonospora sp. DT44]|uniref:hypothetical protein n=1 Tax=Micromonospora sp. DT44 TaxID=3393439 RepID=UPI003CF8295E